MNLDTLPCEIVTRCFSYLSTKLLISILQLENLPENIFQAVAENCNNLWYSKQIRGANKQRIEGIEAHYETDFDQFLRIREIIEKISPQCPLWFHCTWENIHQMHQTLDEINFVYNNQKLGIHVDLKDLTFRDYPVFSDHDINLKITSLSLDVHFASCIDLNSFPKLETFYGKECEIIVDYAHPSLKNLYLSHGIFITLPVNLKKLVAKDCTIIMNENHPKLEALRELVIEDARAPHNCTLLLQVLWNKNLKTFSCTGLHASDTTEVHSMIGPKVTNLGLDDSHPSTLLPYLVSFDGTDLNNMANFTHVSSLTLRQPWGDINDCQLPPNLLELILELPSGKISSLKFPLNLLKLSITNGKFEDLSNFNFPPGIVDLKIEACDITLASGCLKPSLPARLKRLSLQANSLSSFHAVLPCCEYLSLNYNELTEVQIDAPVLELLDLTKNQLTSIPQLPACLQVLILKENKLAISQLSELPSSLKLLDLSKAEYLALQNYTFPSSVQELYLTEIELLSMSGVKFAKGSRLKELDMSRSRITRIDDSFSYSIDNGMIELPAGLKVLKMQGNYFRNIKRLTIPQTVTFLDLRDNDFKSFKVGTHIETLYLNGNNLKREFVVPNGLELRVLDLTNFGYSFDILRAEKLIQLRLGEEYEVIDISKLPVNFQRGHTGSHETGLPSSSPFDFFRNQYKFSYIRPPRDISRTPNSMNQELPWLFLRNPISEDNMSSHVSQSYLNRFQVLPFLSLRNSTRWRHWQTSNHGVWSPEWFFD